MPCDTGFYTIKEIEKIVERTAPTIYAFMRIDEETRDFFKEHRKTRKKGGYLYDEEALTRLKKQYLEEDAVAIEVNREEEAAKPQTTPPPSAEIEALKQELAAERAKNQALQADFEKAEGERVELLRQNGLKTDEINHLLLLLSQEKAEKQALLPPPRKSIGEKLKELFRRKVD